MRKLTAAQQAMMRALLAFGRLVPTGPEFRVARVLTRLGYLQWLPAESLGFGYPRPVVLTDRGLAALGEPPRARARPLLTLLRGGKA